MKSFLGKFYRHLAIFSGHTVGGQSDAELQVNFIDNILQVSIRLTYFRFPVYFPLEIKRMGLQLQHSSNYLSKFGWDLFNQNLVKCSMTYQPIKIAYQMSR